MANELTARTERAEAYIKKCRRRRLRDLRRRERNIGKMVVAIERSAGIVALVLVGIIIGGRMV